MKILYSQIKELVPGLKASAKEVGAALTLTGFMLDSFAEVKWQGRRDYLLGFEIRQNRADCLSVFGLAREVAAYYGLKTSLPKVKKIVSGGDRLNIKVKADKFVKRILAVKLAGLKNSDSPAWLKQYLDFQGMNSVNLLVDLSNYVMFLTGYPSHLIDFNKLNGRLSWSLNRDFKEITTLFGNAAPLKKEREIIIRDDKNIIALAGLVGGQAAQIDEKTDSLVAEMAIYDRAVIRSNSRSLNIVTEASRRLEKELDPNGLDYALALLAALLKEQAQGQPASRLFSYYPVKYVSPTIKFDPSLPGQFAGIEIPPAKTVKIFTDLEFSVKKSGASLLVTPPTYRQDLALAEDLVEEVIRIHGYDKIPADQAPKLEVAPEITPKNIILAEQARDILTALGFDEILSLPLVKKGDNALVNYLPWQTVSTQNATNDLYPDLRQSLAPGLLSQADEYDKKNVQYIDIFEIGKVFGQNRDGQYLEHESLGLLSASQNPRLPQFKNSLENLLRSLRISDLKYYKAKSGPTAANPNSGWDIYANETGIGIIYKLKPRSNQLNCYFAEVNLNLIASILDQIKNSPVVELTKKLIQLDANIELAKNKSIYSYLNQLEKKINKNNIWSLNIADAYPLADKIRYTIRVVYKELTDREAKRIHLKNFNLK